MDIKVPTHSSSKKKVVAKEGLPFNLDLPRLDCLGAFGV